MNRKFWASIVSYHIPRLFAYSDASNEGLASIYKEKDKVKICTKNFNFVQKSESSAWRGVRWNKVFLEYSKNDLRIKPVKWLTDACSIIAKSDSKKDILQELAVDIFNIIFENEISLEVSRFLERIIH